MVHVKSFRLCDPTILVLFLAWAPFMTPELTLGVSLSNGQVGILSFGPGQQTLRLVQAHSLEAWTLAWSLVTDGDRKGNLYSGGDDSTFCEHRKGLIPSVILEEDEGADDSFYDPLNRDRKTHGAGITAILPTSSVQDGGEIVLTGSYDEYIRVVVFLSSSKRLNVLAEIRLGGGVWRLKALHNTAPNGNGVIHFDVVASCMHAGARILDVRRSTEGSWSIEVLAKFVEHESMNYASDARYGFTGDEEGDFTVISTSFYDKKLCMWKFKEALTG